MTKLTERERALRQVRNLIEKHELSWAEIMDNEQPRQVRTTVIAYRNPQTGETWDGKLPRPEWIKEHLASGRPLRALAIGRRLTLNDPRLT